VPPSGQGQAEDIIFPAINPPPLRRQRTEEVEMKVVGIIASPHEDGSGAALTREALSAARQAGATVREISLSDCRIEFCRDCRACMRTGRCVIPDDFQDVRSGLLEADGIILCSPTYASAMSARMKNLFDRLGQFAFLASSLGGKYVVGIATASSFGAKKVARAMAAGVQQGVFRRGYVTGTLAVHLKGKHVSSLPGALRAASALGRKIVEDFKAGKKYPLQNLLGRIPNALIMRPMIKKAIEQNKGAMSGVYQELSRIGVFQTA
jgi:multimeric flavodoxin WrbA